ncbi:MAG: hypothetical protein A3F84_04020 [Candidatus Handelsmanbacteria bacterium RIFCSPLOWO2_12_FULL_64_10]|uniref:Flippase-like domain-containing protein n=1 Tax=Handelsmanbacteria sp. (strain RIFCSPLOWO2_12_FULL_64_10) TaxID=1817868 RepID=A0A1F6CSZ4_HANXR|nr:MAG: hypothetical protein A3F84_04020 [Candidatus Handelsmanbacteria bacterium RIFCSPLOWO2_12_FULL_64_10]
MKLIRRALQVAVLGVILYYLFRDLSRNWQEVTRYSWRFDIPRLALATLMLCAVLGAMTPIWGAILRRMGYDLPIRKAWRIWFISNLGRYVPGKVWQVTGMAYLCEREGIPKRVTAVSVVLGQALSTLSAAGLFGLYVVLEGGRHIDPAWAYSTGGLLIVGGLAVHPRVLERLINFILRLLKRDPVRIELTFGQLLYITGLYTLSWCGYGLSLYVFIFSLTPISLRLVWALIPIHALAYTAGLLVLVMPGGLGVRESFLAEFLSHHLPEAVATPSAWLSRLWFTAAEILCLAVAAGVGKGQIRTIRNSETQESRS